MRRIVMLGSGPGVRGGVSAMVEVLRSAGLFDRWRIEAIATPRDGSPARKLACAARAWLRCMALLLTGRVALVHVHLNSGASFWRKAMFVVPARLLRVPTLLHVHCGRFP